MEFFSNGTKQRVIWKKDKTQTVMFETEDDRKVTGVWIAPPSNDILSFYLDLEVSKSSNDIHWRALEHTGVDKGFIRDTISALNALSGSYDYGSIEMPEEMKQTARDLIEAARPIWQRCEDEAIPDPMPAHQRFDSPKNE